MASPTLTEYLTDVADAIRIKDGSTGIIPALDYPDRIRAIPAGGGALIPKDVNFRDHLGTLIASYTAEEAAALTSLPDIPSYDGLVAQGWNWSLTDIRAQRRADVGAMYVTESGKTEFDITVTIVTGFAVSLMITATTTQTITVEWGDGTQDAQTTAAGAYTFSHTYAGIGNYTISVDSGSAYSLTGTAANPYNIFRVLSSPICTGVRIGARCNIGAYALYSLLNLISISIPSNVISIGAYAFYSCYSLTSISIPSDVTVIGNYTFNSCYRLASISLPSNVTSINVNAFYQCYSLTSISIPGNVTSIGAYSFSNCFSVIEYVMKPITPPTLVNANAFGVINGICIIYVPVGSLNAYKTASNWSTYANYMRGMEV